MKKHQEKASISFRLNSIISAPLEKKKTEKKNQNKVSDRLQFNYFVDSLAEIPPRSLLFYFSIKNDPHNTIFFFPKCS